MDLTASIRDRRVVGLVVLLLAVLAVIVVPSITGRPTAGAPVRTAAPIVGDCVRTTIPWGVDGLGGDGDLDRPSGVPVACQEPGAARVIARTSTLSGSMIGLGDGPVPWT